MKVCKKCFVEKQLDDFYQGRSKCKECLKQEARERYDSKTLEERTSYYHKNKEKIKSKKRKYDLEYYQKNKRKIRKYKKEQRENKQDWNSKNPEKRQEYIREWSRTKRKTDPLFNLRNAVSCAIRAALRNQNQTKSHSCWQSLSYTPQQLKEHLESQFEPWMNWDNYGKYESDRQTWQIDHIIPQSLFLYESIDDERFQECWSLNNLRPLSTIENIKKGNK